MEMLKYKTNAVYYAIRQKHCEYQTSLASYNLFPRVHSEGCSL